jgi:hypothetical protein
MARGYRLTKIAQSGRLAFSYLSLYQRKRVHSVSFTVSDGSSVIIQRLERKGLPIELPPACLHKLDNRQELQRSDNRRA